MAGKRKEFTLRLEDDEAEAFARFLFEKDLTAQAVLKEGALAVMRREGAPLTEQPYGLVNRQEDRIVRSVLSFLRAKDESPFRAVALLALSLIAKHYRG